MAFGRWPLAIGGHWPLGGRLNLFDDFRLKQKCRTPEGVYLKIFKL
jgi:hypothetical protein